MMKYSKKKSMMMFKENTMSKKKSIIKIKIMKKQVKKLMMFKKLKILDSIKILRNKKRFDIQKIINLIINLSMKQLLKENQQLLKKFAWNLQSFISRYRVKKVTIAQKNVSIKEVMSNVIIKAFKMITET